MIIEGHKLFLGLSNKILEDSRIFMNIGITNIAGHCGTQMQLCWVVAKDVGFSLLSSEAIEKVAMVANNSLC